MSNKLASLQTLSALSILREENKSIGIIQLHFRNYLQSYDIPNNNDRSVLQKIVEHLNTNNQKPTFVKYACEHWLVDHHTYSKYGDSSDLEANRQYIVNNNIIINLLEVTNQKINRIEGKFVEFVLHARDIRADVIFDCEYCIYKKPLIACKACNMHL